MISNIPRSVWGYLLVFQIVAAAVLIVILIRIIVKHALGKQQTKTKKHGIKQSRRYQYILSLKDILPAEPLQAKYVYRYRFPSKPAFDRLDPNKQIMHLVASQIPPLDLVLKALHNRRMLEQYEEKMKLAPPFQAKHKGLFYAIERMQLSKLERRIRPVVPDFIVIYSYTSPKGRNHYRVDYAYSPENIALYYQKYQANPNDQQQYERSLITKSLRYEVLQRDRFSCSICGTRAEDGVTLEVEFIRPPSEGGKVKLSNLHTVCSRCSSSHTVTGWPSKEDQEYERKKMTSKLRAAIKERDGYRCKICGKSEADGVKLEVDHIVPISKGGLTVEDNLQTLCQDCNRGKGAKYDPFGFN